MNTPSPPTRDLQGWVSYLGNARLPILVLTRKLLLALQNKMDMLSARHLSEVILRDPLLALQVIIYLQQHQGQSRNHDITTVGQSLLMLGMQPFFRHFTALPTADTLFAHDPAALRGTMQVISRSRHAALYAHTLSELRHDIESGEVMLAALLHDIAEILMWCFNAAAMQRIEHLLEQTPGLRSTAAQQQVLGFSLGQLQHELIMLWRLPEMLQVLMQDDKRQGNQRTACTALAVDLARHSACSWHNPAVPHDMALLGQTLHMEEERLWPHLRTTALLAAKEWHWYNIRPAAAGLAEAEPATMAAPATPG